MSASQERLSKIMAARGLCSRREADVWIERGWVNVDGQPVTVLGTRIHPDQRITVAPQAQREQRQSFTVLFNKPIGVVSGQAEDGHEPALRCITPERHWADDPLKENLARLSLRGMAPAGRLDIDSTGLLVLTQDGRIAKHLIGADSEVEKEYLVRVQGHLAATGLALLNHGLTLDGKALRPARVAWQNRDQLRFILQEGRKRQIRRMCEAVGLTVLGLKRVRIGRVMLGALPIGQWRFLGPQEIF